MSCTEVSVLYTRAMFQQECLPPGLAHVCAHMHERTRECPHVSVRFLHMPACMCTHGHAHVCECLRVFCVCVCVCLCVCVAGDLTGRGPL
jgi:hypothetical protein